MISNQYFIGESTKEELRTTYSVQEFCIIKKVVFRNRLNLTLKQKQSAKMKSLTFQLLLAQLSFQ